MEQPENTTKYKIESIVTKIKMLWNYYPDWSITQVIDLIKCGYSNNPKPISDSAFERRLDDLIEMSEKMKDN